MRIRVLHKAGLPTFDGRSIKFGETFEASAVQAEKLISTGYAAEVIEKPAKKAEAA